MSPLPKIQQAQYGDSAKLEQLGAGRITRNPAAPVQSWKDGAGGRPVEDDPVKLATRAATQRRPEGQLSPEEAAFAQQFDSLSEMHRKVQDWVALASQPGAGRLTKMWAMSAMRAYRNRLRAERGGTPFFRGL